MIRPALLAFSALGLLRASQPSPADLLSALDAARTEWGYSDGVPIEFRWDAMNACDLRTTPDVATTQVLDTQTTMHFDDGTADITEHSYTYVIRMNSNCDWSKLDLAGIVRHEMGHIVISGAYHSRDKRSIMYPVVRGAQSITAGDRAELARAIAERAR